MNRSSPAPALFLDRDGTLIFDKRYLSDPAKVEIIPGVPEALRRALGLGYRLYLFSNQSGVGRGYFTLEQVEAVNARMEEMIDVRIPLFDGICLATERPDEPPVWRKPEPRFILERIAADHLDPERSWMVGDSPSDYLAGKAAGIGHALVRTGKHGDPSQFIEVQRDRPEIFGDLLEFVKRKLR